MKTSALALLALFLLSPAAFAGEELAVGSDAPRFSLLNATDGKYVAFDPAKSALSVVIFTCNHCPYAKAFEPRIIELAKQYAPKGVAFLAVNPNDDVAYPEETMDLMKARATSKRYPFPYLKDTDSTVAAKYGARVTPHVFVVDSRGKVRYRGYVDDSAKAEERTHAGLTEALNALLAGGAVRTTSTKAFGCSIKWKKASQKLGTRNEKLGTNSKACFRERRKPCEGGYPNTHATDPVSRVMRRAAEVRT